MMASKYLKLDAETRKVNILNGSSLSVIIPSDMAKRMGIQKGDKMKITLSDDTILIRKEVNHGTA